MLATTRTEFLCTLLNFCDHGKVFDYLIARASKVCTRDYNLDPSAIHFKLFWYKTKLFKATFIPHIRAVGPIKKLEALEVRLLAHIGKLKKICFKKNEVF